MSPASTSSQDNNVKTFAQRFSALPLEVHCNILKQARHSVISSVQYYVSPDNDLAKDAQQLTTLVITADNIEKAMQSLDQAASHQPFRNLVFYGAPSVEAMGRLFNESHGVPDYYGRKKIHPSLRSVTRVWLSNEFFTTQHTYADGSENPRPPQTITARQVNYSHLARFLRVSLRRPKKLVVQITEGSVSTIRDLARTIDGVNGSTIYTSFLCDESVPDLPKPSCTHHLHVTLPLGYSDWREAAAKMSDAVGSSVPMSYSMTAPGHGETFTGKELEQAMEAATEVQDDTDDSFALQSRWWNLFGMWHKKHRPVFYTKTDFVTQTILPEWSLAANVESGEENNGDVSVADATEKLDGLTVNEGSLA